MAPRTCTECSRVFVPSSRHLRCPACRSRDTCACGSPKQASSVTCGSCRTTAGSADGRWAGGRTRHKAGYLMVLLREHPRAGRNGYVFEHVLVMEQLLGRHLVPGETVHHLNGVRDDDRRPTWSCGPGRSPPASGPRTPSPWAREVLARYAHAPAEVLMRHQPCGGSDEPPQG